MPITTFGVLSCMSSLILGDEPIKLINAGDLLTVLRKIEAKGILDTAHKTKRICGQIFRYAVATGRAERNITADLAGALPPTKKKHRSTITDPLKVAQLLRAIDGYNGHFVTICALKLAPLLFLRPVELRKAEWSEVDFERREMKIEANKMKKKKPLIVPLADQAIKILQEIQPFTQHRSKYVFPAMTTNTRSLSSSTILYALRQLGYDKEEMSGHGFRAMASTLLNENNWRSDLIELQLAHSEENGVRAAYNHALHLEERKKMMQWWADYLDKLKTLI